MWTTFEGIPLLITGAAIRFQGVYWEGPLWFPRSQIILEDDDDIDSPFKILKVKNWLADKRGLLEFTHYSAEEVEAMNAQ